MQKVVSFYEKLPRGAAPEPEAKGLLGRYQKAYFGKNASARRECTSDVGGDQPWSLLSIRHGSTGHETDLYSARPRYWLPDRARLRTELLLPSP
jgi:hypothetical protein